MAHTTITDLAHAPVELLLAALAERQPRQNTIFNSPLVLNDKRNFANRALEDGAVDIEIPLISPVAGGYTLQNPGNPPTPDNITSGRQKAPVMYLEKAWGRDAFSLAQSGMDPLAYVADRLLNVRFDGAEDLLIAVLNGLFASDDFADLIFDTSVNEAPVGVPGSNVYWDADLFHDMTGILGVKEDDLEGGIITMHSKLRTYLKKQNELTTVKPSEGQGIAFQVYKGLRIVCDDRLVRNGTTSGKIYPVTIAAPGTVVFNFATQNEDGTTSSSLAFDSDVPNLRKALYDRVVAVAHINGTVWTPTGPNPDLTIAKGGPTAAQLATAQSWNTAYENVKETRIVRAEVNV
jgi:hypothetical protein